MLLILAAISIATLTGENGILRKADTARNATERAEIIESARVKILEKQTENLGTLTEKELTNILTPTYGTLSSDGETVLDKTLTTTDSKYQIPVREIWNGEFLSPEVEMITFTLEVPSCSYTVKKGTTIREFIREHGNDKVGERNDSIWYHFNNYQEDWPDDHEFWYADSSASGYFHNPEGTPVYLGDEIMEGNYNWW